MYDEWVGCYNLGWKGLLIPEAFSHPAKFSRALIFRIIEHALAEGMIQPGQTILDPFGGVGLGALPSLMNGLNWVGCELEERFCLLGRKNIDLWNAKFSSMPKWIGTAQLLQGDSRRLAEVIAGAGLVVSSPPYAESLNAGKGGIDWEKAGRPDRLTTQAAGIQGANGREEKYGSTMGQLGAMKEGDITAVISSPPFAGNTGGRGEASRNGIDAALFDRHSGGMKKGTGSDPANLDHLPMGQVGAVISSPPYADGCAHTGGDDPNPEHIQGSKRGAYGVTVVSSPPFADSVGSDDPDKRGGLFRDEKRRNDVNLTGSYGDTLGQLGAMKAGLVVSSPPFENVGNYDDRVRIFDQTASTLASRKNAGVIQKNYGDTPGQIGTESGETFWIAAAQIVQQCALILPPGAWAIWVVKSYVKNGKIVDFPAQWAQLCEACGFELKHEHRAMLVKANGKQVTIDGGTVDKSIERKSFFRRLAEKKGAPRIDWETVLCFQRK